MMSTVPETPPADDELIIGIIAALGIDLQTITAELRVVLSEFGYRSYDLHLTDAFVDFQWSFPLVEEPFDERIWSYMDAGDTLCQQWKRHEAMAMLAIQRVALARATVTGNDELPSRRTAYILRSLKRPKEVELLRAVYRDRFFVVGVATEEQARLQYLKDRIRQSRLPPIAAKPVYSAEALAARDEKDDGIEHGQAVRDTFHQADIFVDLSGDVSHQLKRAFDAVHHSPRATPSRDEVGMMHAATAALRSAELGRQVGAAICTEDGALVATGANEVPKAFGGQYWGEDAGDARDLVGGWDTNTKRRREVALEISDELDAQKLLAADATAADVLKIVEQSHFGDVIEYVRAVHAEMAALIDAARRSALVDGCTLYTTTFPCHHCARHIIAAGIARVVFISPYAKSLALSLHGDALIVGRHSSQKKRVPFEPFVGVGPLRYRSLFTYSTRKLPDGSLLSYNRMLAPAVLDDREPTDLRSDNLPYLQRERRAAKMMADAEQSSNFKLKRS